MELIEYLKNPITAYLKCERYINDGSPSKNNNTTSKETSPKSSTGQFYLKLIKFSNDVVVEEIGEKSILFPQNTICIHPDMLTHDFFVDKQLTTIEEFLVEPTASGRTVLANGAYPIFLKLAYPKCLGRLTRHMGREKISSACEVTKRLIEAIDSKKMNKKFALLKEDSGRVAHIPTSEGDYEWGMIIRDFYPYPHTEEEYLMPIFSLFSSEYTPGEEKTNTNHVFFLKQFFLKQTKKSDTFLLEDIIFPLFDCYFDALLKAGIELEAHSQNMLIAFDSKFKIKRIVCRDLESAGRDITLMERLGLSLNTDNINYKCNKLLPIETGHKYPKWYITHSFMFDYKLGEYVITPLINCAKSVLPGFNEEYVINKIKEYNQKYIQQLPDFFPPDWCYYSNENFEATGNKKVYIWEESPKYR